MGLIYSSLLATADDPKAEKIEQFESYYSQNYQELIYVQADKKLFLAGERIKFKVYCLEQSKLRPSELSKVAYLEILDTKNTPKVQVKISLNNGIGFGDVLIPINMNSGNFILRSYTRWMQNFGPETFHHSMITIINPFKKARLKPRLEKNDISIDFFPEGGTIINGKKSKLVFDIKNGNNYPLKCSGKLFANDSILISEFTPQINGMGYFEFTPDPSIKYHVELQQKGGNISRYDIPEAVNTGLILKANKLKNRYVVNIFSNDQSIINVDLFYIVHGNGSIIRHDNISLSSGRASFDVDESLLEAGVSTISLFNAQGTQLASRSIFKNYGNDGISVNLNKTKFKPREKVIIDISSMEKNIPFDSIDLSVSVTGIHQYFKSNKNNLIAHILLKNSIGSQIIPEQYFENMEDESSIDNLLIAYGNERFGWQNESAKKQVSYIPEYQGQLITGKVWNNTTNKPAWSVLTYLSIPGKNAHFYATKSNQDGSIVFEIKEIYGSNKIIVQNDYSKDTIYNIEIDNAYFEEYVNYKLPVFDLDESIKDWLEQMSQNAQIENANKKFRSKTSVLTISDSSNFYNEPDYRYYLDDFTRFIVMEEVMREYVYGINVRKNKNGFHFMAADIERRIIYQDNPLMLLDGVPIFDANEIITFDPLKIKKIETVNQRFFKGVLDCKGIVNYNTYDGDLAGYQLNEKSIVLDYEGVQPLKNYEFPEYNSSFTQKASTPDFRNTLYWSPEIKVSSKDGTTIEFYTSDDQNNYIIQVAGVSKTGKPFSAFSQFEVAGK